MAGNIVDDVVNGRRFPYSRVFARAGFSPDDAESWRRAGWDDAEHAAPWHQIATEADAATLRALASAGFDAGQVARVARFAPGLTAAWTHALLGERTERDVDLRDRHDVDLRRPAGEQWSIENHPIGP